MTLRVRARVELKLFAKRTQALVSGFSLAIVVLSSPSGRG